MSQFLSKTLIRHGNFLPHRFFKPFPATVAAPSFVNFRCFHSLKPRLIEIDLDSSSSGKTEGGAEFDPAILKKLNELVRRIMVQSSTPDWLPFVPGSSFWVPPHQKTAAKIANLVDKVTNQLTEEESLSLVSPYGWPCSSFFISPDESSSSATQEVEVSMEFNIPGNDMLEVKLALFPDPVYSYKPGDDEE